MTPRDHLEHRELNGRYRLVYQLGAGGMGSVWLAEDQLLERSVALKELMLRAGTADLPARRTRALQEARAMARVRHPAIVPIHDVFFIDEDPWIVMEYISGRSLHELMKRKPLDERSIARIGLHVLRGLNAVHRVGVVHRDVKPTNILVADDDSVFLVDFGIARIAGDESLTGHAIVGTPDYVAPERFRSKSQVGAPADIWALGVTFYCAMEGFSPFWRDSDRGWEAIMLAVISDEPRQPVNRGRLAEITMRMLDKDPQRRATADQVLTVLQEIVADQVPVPASPAASASPAPSGRRPRQHAAAAPWPGEPSRPAPARPAPLGDPGVARRGTRVDEAREMIRNVGIDTGVAMLLTLTEEEAARVLADCPHRLCGMLLQGIAAVRADTATAILRILGPAAAGSAFSYLRPPVAASLVAAMPPPDALRVLDNTDERTAAAVIMELPADTSGSLLRGMRSRQRAAQVLTHVRPVTAAELLRPDARFATAVLQHLREPVRRQVSRHLLTGLKTPD